MARPDSDGSSGGLDFLGLLTILFIGLKLGNVIHWPWVWVLSPIWISMSIWLIALVVVCVIVCWSAK